MKKYNIFVFITTKNIFMNLDREISKKALTDGFCLLYGESYRELFDTVGEEIIELGIKNGRKYFKEYSIHTINRVGLHIMIDHFSPQKRYNTVEDFTTKIRTEIKPFLSSKNIESLLVEQPYKSFNDGNFAYPTNGGEIFQKIADALENVKPTPARKIPSFDYFKQFPTYDTNKKSLTLATEGGFGLDQFNYKSVKYYLEENEEFYLAETIPYKYHQLGSTLVREEMRLELVEKIKTHITKDSDYWVMSVLREMITTFCFSSEVDSTLLKIQKDCDITEGFQTSKQIHNKVMKFSSDKKKMEELKKLQE